MMFVKIACSGLYVFCHNKHSFSSYENVLLLRVELLASLLPDSL